MAGTVMAFQDISVENSVTVQGRLLAGAQASGAGALTLNMGTLYPGLMRLEQQGLIASEWGASDNNRQAKFYQLTRAGRRQLTEETKHWERLAQAVRRLGEHAIPRERAAKLPAARRNTIGHSTWYMPLIRRQKRSRRDQIPPAMHARTRVRGLVS